MYQEAIMKCGYKPSSLLLVICLGLMLPSTYGGILTYSAQGASLTQTNCQRFEQTGHEVCGRFLQYWTQNGGLRQQGYPISSQLQERSDTNG
jgi:hypothetical protein